jgi:hypothetical protein
LPERKVGPAKRVPIIDPKRQPLIEQAAIDVGGIVALKRLDKVFLRAAGFLSDVAFRAGIFAKYGRYLNVEESMEFLARTVPGAPAAPAFIPYLMHRISPIVLDAIGYMGRAKKLGGEIRAVGTIGSGAVAVHQRNKEKR